MYEESEILRERLRAERPRNWQLGWPEDLRLRVARHAQRRQAEGESWQAIGASLGLSRTTVRSWAHAHADATIRGVEPGWEHAHATPGAEVVPVIVAGAPESPSPAGGMVLVSPRGFRLEGLDLDAAIAVLERLG